MLKKRLMEELLSIIMQVPWEDRVLLVTGKCQQVVDEICPSEGEVLLTPGQFDLLNRRLVSVVKDSAPEGLYLARLDLERSAAAAIKKVCSGKVIPDSPDGPPPFISRAKALFADIRRSARGHNL